MPKKKSLVGRPKKKNGRSLLSQEVELSIVEWVPVITLQYHYYEYLGLAPISFPVFSLNADEFH